MNETTLIENTKLSNQNCAWCDARKNKDTHSKACPLGERYKQVQQLGGVAWPKGKPFLNREDFTNEYFYRRFLFRNSTAPSDDKTRCLECGIEVEPFDMVCEDCFSYMKASA